MNFARIARLRDKLLDAGRPSLRPPPPPSPAAGGVDAAAPESSALYVRVQPLAEVMFLVMCSDGAIAPRERIALCGMLRTLTDGALSSQDMERMLAEFAGWLARDGLEQRLDTIAARVYAEPEERELALALAAATALADSRVEPSEVATVSALAARLGVPQARARRLLDGAE